MADYGQFIQYEFYSVMPAPDSAMKAGHSAKSQKPAFLRRNHLLACSGIGCFLPSEWGAALQRILHLAYGERGAGSIPPNATLIFEVELIDFLQ